MTKKLLAKTILECVDNFRAVGDTDEEIIEGIEGLLATLKPKNEEQFELWGYNLSRRQHLFKRI